MISFSKTLLLYEHLLHLYFKFQLSFYLPFLTFLLSCWNPSSHPTPQKKTPLFYCVLGMWPTQFNKNFLPEHGW